MERIKKIYIVKEEAYLDFNEIKVEWGLTSHRLKLWRINGLVESILMENGHFIYKRADIKRLVEKLENYKKYKKDLYKHD
jgi:hypothetical protein